MLGRLAVLCQPCCQMLKWVYAENNTPIMTAITTAVAEATTVPVPLSALAVNTQIQTHKRSVLTMHIGSLWDAISVISFSWNVLNVVVNVCIIRCTFIWWFFFLVTLSFMSILLYLPLVCLVDTWNWSKCSLPFFAYCKEIILLFSAFQLQSS